MRIAITGASGTVGPALLEQLAAAPEVASLIAVGRRRTPEMASNEKVSFRPADVRDADAVRSALAGADAVIHMAFSLYGVLLREPELFRTNVQGTLNVARAAAAVGVRRFVYTSSAAVYGDGGTPEHPLSEDAEIRASIRLFYARHKAQAELVLQEALADSSTELTMVRPCAIVGPHAAGALASRLPAPFGRAGTGVARLAARSGLRPALAPPPVPLQFVHEADVAQALALAARGHAPAGVYNLAGDGWLDGPDVLREVGLRPLPLPGPATRATLGLLGQVPPLLPAIGWFELIRRPLLVDTARAHETLGWRPRYSSREALQATREAIGW